MIKYCTFPLLAAFYVGIAQAASADLPKPEPLEVIAKSSDSQFFLLNDDTAWFVITDQHPELSELAADRNAIEAIKVGDHVSITHADDQPFFTVTHEQSNTELVALKTHSIFTTTLGCTNSRLTHLENGLILKSPPELDDALSEGNEIRVATLHQEVKHLGNHYLFNFQWLAITYRNWFFQHVSCDAVQGEIHPIETDSDAKEPHSITSISFDNKTIKLGNGAEWVNVEYSEKNDQDGNPSLVSWNVGDTIEAIERQGQPTRLKNMSTTMDGRFLKPTLTVESTILTDPITIFYDDGNKGWVFLANGWIVELEEAHASHFNVGDAITYYFLSADDVPQKTQAVNVTYQLLVNHTRPYSCSDDSISVPRMFGYMQHPRVREGNQPQS